MGFSKDGVATAGLGGGMGCLAMLQVKQLDAKVNTSWVINRMKTCTCMLSWDW